MEYKICSSCSESKPIIEFYKNHNGSPVRVCKRCKAFNSRNANPSRFKKTYIYIITNPVFNGWCKIGRSTNPESRLKSYNTGDPFRGYRFELLLEVFDPYPYELFFKENIESNDYEWFFISAEEAKKTIQKIYEKNN